MAPQYFENICSVTVFFVSNFFSGNAWSILFKSILVIWSLSIFPDELKASLLLAVLCSSNKMVCWYFRNRKPYLFLWSLRSRLKKKTVLRKVENYFRLLIFSSFIYGLLIHTYCHSIQKYLLDCSHCIDVFLNHITS